MNDSSMSFTATEPVTREQLIQAMRISTAKSFLGALNQPQSLMSTAGTPEQLKQSRSGFEDADRTYKEVAHSTSVRPYFVGARGAWERTD
jgi:hypothetical protein